MRSIVSAALLSCLCLASSTRAQTRVFASDFEDGATDAWAQDGGRDRCAVVTAAVDGVAPRGGSRMLECNWNGLVEWNDPQAFTTLTLRSWDYTNEFLIRFWVRFASDVDRAFGSKLFRLDPNDGQHSFYLAAQLENSVGPLFSYWEFVDGSNGPIFWGDDTPFGNGEWREIEIYVRASEAGDGIFRVWQDGDLKQESVGLTTIAPGARWYPLYVMSNWSNNGPKWEHDDNNHVYWDDFEIFSDAMTGTALIGSLADGTASVSDVVDPIDADAHDAGPSSRDNGAAHDGGTSVASRGGCSVSTRSSHASLWLLALFAMLAARRSRIHQPFALSALAQQAQSKRDATVRTLFFRVVSSPPHCCAPLRMPA